MREGRDNPQVERHATVLISPEPKQRNGDRIVFHKHWLKMCVMLTVHRYELPSTLGRARWTRKRSIPNDVISDVISDADCRITGAE